MGDNNLLIDEDVINTANELNNYSGYDDVKDIVAANYIAYKLALDFFRNKGFNVIRGVATSAEIVRDLNICDIYVDGNYIDVRLYFEDNELCIPSKAFDKGIIPSLYMFIKVADDLKEASITGFITPESIQTNLKNINNYPISSDNLLDFEDVQSNLIPKDSANFLPTGFEKQIIDYFDGVLTDYDSFYSELINSELARNTFLAYLQTKNLLNATNFDTKDFYTDDDARSDVTEIADTVIEYNDNDSELLGNYTLDDSALLTDENSALLDENIMEPNLEIADTYLLNDEDNDSNLSIDTFDDNLVNIEEQNPINNTEEINLANEEFLPMETQPDNVELIMSEENNAIDDTEINLIDATLQEDSTAEDNDNNEGDTVVDDSEELIELFDVEDEITEIDSQTEEQPNDEIDKIAESVAGLYEQVSLPNQINEEIQQVNEEVPETENERNYETVMEENLTTTEMPVYDNNYMQDDFSVNVQNIRQTKQKNPILTLLILVLIAATGFLIYSKVFNAGNSTATTSETSNIPVQEEKTIKTDMPVETVENNSSKEISAEIGNNVSLPAIENNLNISIAVSNLKISWEVPSSYMANQSMKRYFNKVGKIIQLNLKTELLLLSKPPITNKIAIELELNKNGSYFNIKEIVASSGETDVDHIVTETVKNILNKHTIKGTSALKDVKGNPVLVIHL